jgi:hypothetical protein
MYPWDDPRLSWWTDVSNPQRSVGAIAFDICPARNTYDHGGYSENSVFEDVVLRKRLRHEGRFVKLKPLVRTSARRYRKHGAVRTQPA